MPRKKSAADVDFDRRVGQRIEAARKKKDFAGVKLARQLGISYNQLYWYETGRSSCPLRTLKKIAVALEVPMGALIPN